MNRIEAAIERQRLTIEAKGFTPEKLAATSQNLDMPLEDFVMFQNIKTESWLGGVLTQDEAQTVYNYLGETPEHFNNQPLHVKATLSKLLLELISRKLRRA